MTDCVFCEIIRTEVAEGFIDHEMEYVVDGEPEGFPVVSFIPLNPVTNGHRLFVPKYHFESAAIGVLSSGPAFTMACEWANHRKDVACNIITSHGEEATQTIFHTHIHYVPRREGDGLLLPWSNQKPQKKVFTVPTYDGKPYDIEEDRYTLYNADKNCIHQIETQWSGYKCVKCNGWYCA